jgi:hypothetical protein
MVVITSGPVRNHYDPAAMAELPEIDVTETGLTLDGATLAFDEVETVAYLRKPVNGSGALIDVLRRFELVGAGGRISAKLDGARVEVEEKEALWRQLVAVSQEWIEPRLRRLAMERIQGHGETVSISKLELSPEGFAWRSGLRVKRYAWSEYQEAFYAYRRIRVMATPRGKRQRQVCVLLTDVPNAVLLPRLMTDAAAAFTA